VENPNGFFNSFYPSMSSRDERRPDRAFVPRRAFKPGRRETDFDNRTTLTKKSMVAIVFVVQIFWYVGGLVFYGAPSGCP
jgi:hypothetical protein